MGIFGPLVGLADEVLTLVNTETMRANVEQLKNTCLALQAELDKGYGRDDRLIESYYEKIPIISEAVTNEFKIFNARGAGSSVAATVSAPATPAK